MNKLDAYKVGIDLGYGNLTAKDVRFHRSWRAASGHPGGWRIVRGISPLEEFNGKTGRLILFESYESAKQRADALNSVR